VAEITNRLELGTWPDGTRVIVRRERPHPGAQLSFTDHDGHRFLATLTDLDGDAVELERLHRARASAEDRIRAAKQTGRENLPFRDFDHNAIWLEPSLITQDLTARTQHLTLDGELARCEPKTPRYRPLHTAARPTFHARRATLRLPRTRPRGARTGRRLRPPDRAATTRGLTPARARPPTTTAPPPSADHRCPPTGPDGPDDLPPTLDRRRHQPAAPTTSPQAQTEASPPLTPTLTERSGLGRGLCAIAMRDDRKRRRDAARAPWHGRQQLAAAAAYGCSPAIPKLRANMGGSCVSSAAVRVVMDGSG
jgi:hypothetical protein